MKATLTSPTDQTAPRKRGRPPLTTVERAARAALPPALPKPRNRRADHVSRADVIVTAALPLSGRALTRFEVIARTGLSTSVVYRYMTAGTFPRPFKPSSRKALWRAEDVAAWIAGRFDWKPVAANDAADMMAVA